MANTFYMPEMILSGDNVIEEGIKRIPDSKKKCLILTTECNKNLGFIETFKTELKNTQREWYIYDKINSEPSDVMVKEGLELYKEKKCDFLLAIGGGSALDLMKAIALLAANGGCISHYMGNNMKILNALPYMIAVPTTSGTGSETTQYTIISDTENGVKMLIGGRELIPNMVILEPEFTKTTPVSVSVSTGMDALIHGIEAFLSKKAQMLTDTFAISAIKRIFKYLPIVIQDGLNTEARLQMSYAALEAGIAFSNSSVTLIHGMSRPIGALFHIPHGLSNAMLLKGCMDFMLDSTYERMECLANAIGIADKTYSKRKNAELFLEKLEHLCEICNIPSIEEYGVDKKSFFEVIEKMSEDALASGSPQNLRKSVSKEDIIHLYTKLWTD